MIPDIIDERQIEVGNRIIALSVEMIVIAETVSVYIEVQSSIRPRPAFDDTGFKQMREEKRFNLVLCLPA